MRVWNWGVIGAGGIADRRTIPEGIIASDRCELVAVMDADERRAQEVAAKYGVRRATTDVAELLSSNDVEVVYIATPVRVHAAQAIAAAEAGKHILCEKPLAMTTEECRRIVAAAAANGVKLAVGYMMRFHSLHQRMQQMIAAGAIGQPVRARANVMGWYPDLAGAWRQDPRQGGGGVLPDGGTHCIDLLRMMMGEVRSVCARADTLTHRYPVDDTATLLLTFANGAHGSVEVNFNVPGGASHRRLEVYGTAGGLICDDTIGQTPDGTMTAYLVGKPGEYSATAEAEGPRAQVFAAEGANLYRAEVEHLLDCIETDREPITNGLEATRVQEIVEAAYESARSGRREEISG